MNGLLVTLLCLFFSYLCLCPSCTFTALLFLSLGQWSSDTEGLNYHRSKKLTGDDVSLMALKLSTRNPVCPSAKSVWYHNGTWGQWDSGSGSDADMWASLWAHRKLIIIFAPLADWQGHYLSPYKERNECVNVLRGQHRGPTWLSAKARHSPQSAVQKRKTLLLNKLS